MNKATAVNRSAFNPSSAAPLSAEAMWALIEPLAQVYWETDAEGQVVADSPTWRAYTGQTYDEHLGEGWLQAIHPDDRDYAFRQWREAVLHGKDLNMEYRLYTLNSGWRWTNIRAVPLLNPDGSVQKWVGIHVDIDERRRTEEALRRSEEKYRTLFDSIDEGFVISELLYNDEGKPLDLVVLETNPSFDRMMRIENAVGKRAREIFPDAEDAWFEAYRQVVETNESLRFENYLASIERWFDLYISRVGGEGSRRFAIVFQDITERKRREANLAFLAEISQDLVGLTNIEDTMNLLGAKIGRFFGVKQCVFAEHADEFETSIVANGWNAEDAPNLKGTYRTRDFLSDEFIKMLLTGEPLVVNDTQTDPRVNPGSYDALGIRSFITAPLVRRHEWRFQISILDDKPRDWRKDEIDLLRELALRVWMRLERAGAEEALRVSEERLQVLIANLPGAAVFIVDQNLRYVVAEGEVLHAAGFQPKDLVGNTVGATMPPGLTAQYEPKYRKALAGEPFEHEHESLGRTYISRGVPLRNAAGEVYAVLAVSYDITERKQAEDRLRESEERLRLAVEAAEMGTWEWHLDTDEVYWNDRHFRLFGMEPRPNPLSPDDFLNHVHPADRERISEQLQKAITERGVFDVEFCAVLDDGSTSWMSGYGQVTEEVDGRPVCLSGVMFDIDKRRRAEEALREANRRKDDFLAMLAHELRNPMATLHNALLILQQTGGHNPGMPVSTVVELMNREVNHLVRLVDDLMDVSRISQGKIKLVFERTDLAGVVRRAVETAQMQPVNRKRRLTVSLPGESMYLKGDATRLTQVVSNLLGNAAKFTGENGHIRVSLDRMGDEAVLRVIDDGVGISPADQERIFDVFVQAGNSKVGTEDGLGLGLTLVKSLVELHGGRVEVHSPGVGQGSEFIVYLPVETVESQSPLQPAGHQIRTASGRRVLVVDDNQDAATTLALLLTLNGYETHTRHTGQAGLQAAESLRPEVVLLDISMPGMDGYAVCRQIRQQPWGQELTLVALSGYGQEEDKHRSREAGFDEHLVKPVDLKTLLALLASLPLKK